MASRPSANRSEPPKNRYRIEEAPVAVDDYQRLREAVGWWPVDDRIVAMSLATSLFAVTVRDVHDTVVATGRLVGDPMYMYVQDMIVLPEHQRRGLGAAILERLGAHARHIGGRGSYLGLMCAKGAEPFYTRFGFERRPDDGPGMQRVL